MPYLVAYKKIGAIFRFLVAPNPVPKPVNDHPSSSLRKRTPRYARVDEYMAMSTIKVGVREFRERIASFLESDTPVAVTRRGETRRLRSHTSKTP